MSWFGLGKKQDEKEPGGFDILVQEPGTGFTGYVSEHGAELLEGEGWAQVEANPEYFYCGICGWVHLSQFPNCH
jgi:hypothetical protein